MMHILIAILSIHILLPSRRHQGISFSFSPQLLVPRRPWPSTTTRLSLSENFKATEIQTKDHEPLILSLPEIISTPQCSEILHSIEDLRRCGELVPTVSYQEDIFSREAWDREDADLRAIVQPLVDHHRLPSEYIRALEENGNENEDHLNAPLEAFVYAVTHHQEDMAEDDILMGANIIQRRQAIERWKSEEGQTIMQLSLDGAEEHTINFDAPGPIDLSLGTRYEVPPNLLDQLQALIPKVLKGSWDIRDATLVHYKEGDTQVPHIDPCDATLLICLKNCDEGGSTCFSMLEEPRRLEHRDGHGILFFSSYSIVGDASRDVLSLHHGGKVTKGEKIVVQLMLDWGNDPNGQKDREDDDCSTQDALSWRDVVACL